MRTTNYFGQIILILMTVFSTSSLAQNNQIDSDYSFWENSVARSELFIRNRAIEQPLPVYSASAVAAKIQGQVTIFVVFDASGKVDFTKVVKSPEQAISDEVTSAVKKWTFQPLKYNFQMRRVQGVLRFIFEIKDDVPTVSAPPMEIQRSKCIECNEYVLKVLRRVKASAENQ
jgi:TonB family protein